MRLGGLSLCILGLAWSSCARPSLEDTADADVAVEPSPEDAGADTAEPSKEPHDSGRPVVEKDTGAPVPTEVPDAQAPIVEDAGCQDTDSDGVCNAADNCPDDANPDQRDADNDGIGDVCEPPVAANCANVEIESGLGQSATVDSVLINGRARTLATVAPGALVWVSINVTFSNCGIAFSPAQVYLGVESDDASCQNTACTEIASFTLPFSFAVTAPVASGLHYVMAGVGRSLACGGGQPSNNLSTRVAALCVAPKP